MAPASHSAGSFPWEPRGVSLKILSLFGKCFLLWELERIDPGFTEAGLVSNNLIDFVQTLATQEQISRYRCVPMGSFRLTVPAGLQTLFCLCC